MPVTESASITVNVTPLLVIPSSVSVTGPLVAFVGTVTVTAVSLHVLTFAVVPLNLTMLLAWLVPNPMPFSVTEAPTSAAGGERLLICGLITVNVTFDGPEFEFTVTLTGPAPGAAVLGTVATI